MEAHKMKCVFTILSLMSIRTIAELPPQTDILNQQSETIVEQNIEFKNRQIVSQFNDVYLAKKSPKFIIFWNKKYDDKISDWEPSSIQNKQVEILKGNNSKGSFYTEYSKENRTKIKTTSFARPAPKETDLLQFQSVFTEVLGSANLKLIDRAAILRFASAKDSSETILDIKKLETSALSKYGDYLIEVLFIPDSQHPLGFSAAIEVKSVKTGQLVTKIRSRPFEIERIWTVSENAYIEEERYKNPPSFEGLAQDLSYRLLEKLTLKI